MPTISILGLLGNVLSVHILHSRHSGLDLHTSFTNLLICLAVFDSLFMVCANSVHAVSAIIWPASYFCQYFETAKHKFQSKISEIGKKIINSIKRKEELVIRSSAPAQYGSLWSPPSPFLGPPWQSHPIQLLGVLQVDQTVQLPGRPGPPFHSGHLPTNLFKHVPPGFHHVHSQPPEPAYQPLGSINVGQNTCAPPWKSPPFNILGVLKVSRKLSTLKTDPPDKFHGHEADQTLFTLLSSFWRKLGSSLKHGSLEPPTSAPSLAPSD